MTAPPRPAAPVEAASGGRDTTNVMTLHSRQIIDVPPPGTGHHVRVGAVTAPEAIMTCAAGSRIDRAHGRWRDRGKIVAALTLTSRAADPSDQEADE
jgi:hypothetical protein